MEKICFKCGELKSLDNFYKHSQMNDGHVNKCKECNKKDVRLNYKENADYYRKYDKQRSTLDHRKKLKAEWLPKYRRENPEKYLAHSIVNRAVKSGKLIKGNCEVCGDEKVHGHHDKYDEPLNVRWLCPKHHVEYHKNIEEEK